MPDLSDIDTPPPLLVGWTARNIAELTAAWPRWEQSPAPVAELLAESRRPFVGPTTCYDNLTAASFKALQAAKHAPRLRLGAVGPKTLGQIVKAPGIEATLGSLQLDRYRKFACRSGMAWHTLTVRSPSPAAWLSESSGPLTRSSATCSQRITRITPDGRSVYERALLSPSRKLHHSIKDLLEPCNPPSRDAVGKHVADDHVRI